MSDEIVPEQLLTIPPEEGRKTGDPLKQAIVRIHNNDHGMLKAMLKKDRLSFQKFVNFCVRGYLDGDPLMLKMLKIYRELESVPRDIKDKHVLSHRERRDILDEIERSEKEQP